MKISAIFFMVLAFTSCNSSKKVNRNPSSTSFVVEGVVKVANCDSESGQGIIQVYSRVEQSLKATWYRVRSQELCSKLVENEALSYKISKLAQLSSHNAIGENLIISSLNLDTDEYVIGIETKEKIKSTKYLGEIKYFEESNSINSHYWYFNEVLGSNE